MDSFMLRNDTPLHPPHAFPPSPSPTPQNVGVSPHAPSPSQLPLAAFPCGAAASSPSDVLLTMPSAYRVGGNGSGISTDELLHASELDYSNSHHHPHHFRHHQHNANQTQLFHQQNSDFVGGIAANNNNNLVGGQLQHNGALVLKKKTISLDDIERDLLQTHGSALPADQKKHLAKAEFKRLKHCETVRQSRARKKNERQDLKKVSDELEDELSLSLRDYRARHSHDFNTFNEDSWWDVTFKRFVHSIYEVRALRTETNDLRDKLLYFDTVGEQLERLQHDFAIPPALVPNSRASIGHVHFKPLTVLEARDIMLDSHEQAMSFFQSMSWSHTAAPHEQTNGWTQHQRIQPDGRVQFNFTKRISTIGAHELVQKSWEMYCDLNLYRGIYASVQRLEILQRINEDTLLIRRDLQESSASPIFRTIFLLFRIRLENGYVICFRSHNPQVYADDDDDPNVQWMEMFYWLMVLDPPAPAHPGQSPAVGCDVSFGGNLLNATSAQHATRWKYQIAMALLRWESNAVAPLFAMLG